MCVNEAKTQLEVIFRAAGFDAVTKVARNRKHKRATVPSKLRFTLYACIHLHPLSPAPFRQTEECLTPSVCQPTVTTSHLSPISHSSVHAGAPP